MFILANLAVGHRRSQETPSTVSGVFAATIEALKATDARVGSGRVTKFLAKIVAWISAGYPEGVPGPDRVPLMALLRRRLTDDEVKAVVAELRARAEVGSADVDSVDIGVLITQITDGLPTPDDVERVRARLAAQGWPLDDPREAEDEL